MKLLIADDETLIREAILARLKKGNYAFDEIFLAADGLEAYFSTLFKKKEGVSPLDYLTRIRMEAAKDLLRDTDIPASEVSYLVGYEDPRYFYKVFKKYTGQTPTNFRS